MIGRWIPLTLALALCGCDPKEVPPKDDVGVGGMGGTAGTGGDGGDGGDGGAGGVGGGAMACDGDDCEACNGLDDDGDGITDEDVPGAGDACGSEECGGPGRWTCVSGELICAGVGAIGDEVCNGADDDCDGNIDEDDPRLGEACEACAGTYICDAGTLRCSMGVPEVCNGLNDDCDGAVDEDLTRPCGDETGACEAGVETCRNGEWGGCIGGVGPNGEECNGSDDDCDGVIDEQLAGCNGLGSPCDGDAECSTGLCLDDDGSFYCSRPCDPAEADPCGAGNRCVEVDGRAVCIPDWQRCNNDCECPAERSCMPAVNHPDVVYGCRPERRDGDPVGAPCTAADENCATGTCLARTGRCVRLCAPSAECGGASICDGGTVCAEVPGAKQPICVNACTGDDDCPPYPGLGPDDPQEICRYRPDADRSANVGICDWPNSDGEAVGGPCEGGGDCAHGLCWQPNNADFYCTQGCVTEDDCPDGWQCRPSRLNGLEVSICRQ